VHHDAPPAPTAVFTVDLNAADATELAQLPGLGPATAARIGEHRRAHGPFTSIDSLLDVPGIGAVTLDGLRAHLRPVAPAEAR
jgi:competence protein ComEA